MAGDVFQSAGALGAMRSRIWVRESRSSRPRRSFLDGVVCHVVQNPLRMPRNRVVVCMTCRSLGSFNVPVSTPSQTPR